MAERARGLSLEERIVQLEDVEFDRRATDATLNARLLRIESEMKRHKLDPDGPQTASEWMREATSFIWRIDRACDRLTDDFHSLITKTNTLIRKVDAVLSAHVNDATLDTLSMDLDELKNAQEMTFDKAECLYDHVGSFIDCITPVRNDNNTPAES
jgi:hypothetical protein